MNTMDIKMKRKVAEEFSKSGLNVATFARKNQIPRTTMQRLVSAYESGKLKEGSIRDDAKRMRTSQYPELEKRLVEYIQFRNEMYRSGHDKC